MASHTRRAWIVGPIPHVLRAPRLHEERQVLHNAVAGARSLLRAARCDGYGGRALQLHHRKPALYRASRYSPSDLYAALLLAHGRGRLERGNSALGMFRMAQPV